MNGKKKKCDLLFIICVAQMTTAKMQFRSGSAGPSMDRPLHHHQQRLVSESVWWKKWQKGKGEPTNSIRICLLEFHLFIHSLTHSFSLVIRTHPAPLRPLHDKRPPLRSRNRRVTPFAFGFPWITSMDRLVPAEDDHRRVHIPRRCRQCDE